MITNLPHEGQSRQFGAVITTIYFAKSSKNV